MPSTRAPNSISGSADFEDSVLAEFFGAGEVFAGRYRIVRLLSRDALGARFLAQHLVSKVRVALQILWPHLVGNAAVVEHFEFESSLAARLETEHIFAVFDAGVDERAQIPFRVTEHLAGHSLEEAVQRHGPLEPDPALDILKQLALGLSRAHSYVDPATGAGPIVHRDLKPANVFLHPRESGGVLAKIQNFGIAKLIKEPDAGGESLTGTPLFAAPEQIMGAPVGPPADIWAFGLLAHFALTGLHYWRAAVAKDMSLGSLFEEVLGAELTPPSQRLPPGHARAWTEALDDWFLSCVHRETRSRFQSAHQAVSTLESCLMPSLRSPPAFGVDTTMRSEEPPDPDMPLVSPDAPSPSSHTKRREPREVSSGTFSAVARSLFGWMGKPRR